MKWFKHFSSMSNDPKVRRLIRRFGVDGYGVYNYILELIVRRLETESPVPDLEETAGDIAADLQMDTLRVEEIVVFCIDQGLFESDEITGRVVAHKIYKFLDSSTTRNAELKKMISEYKTTVEKSKTSIVVRDNAGQSETVRDISGLSVPEKKRTEEKRREYKKEAPTAEATASRDVSDIHTNIPDKTGKPVNALKDPIAAMWEHALTEMQPSSTWGNYGKERSQCKQLAQRTRDLIEQTPYTDTESLITAVMSEYDRLKRSARTDFWKSAPWTPSAMIARWSAVWESISKQHATEEALVF
jgi:hypothetical protein